jgi:hypothetical protein
MKMSNEAFINEHAANGLVGLVGGNAPIDKAIRSVQNKVFDSPIAGLWSHAFMFSERRADDFWWLLESDLDYGLKRMRIGVQENRASKYYDENLYPNIAILDFGLTPQQTKAILTKGFNLLFHGAKYSIREVLGTFLTVKSRKLRSKENILAQDKSFYCSALVQHCYEGVSIQFQENINSKNITPFDIANTEIHHKSYQLIR